MQKNQVAYIGLNTLFGRIVTSLLKQSPNISKLVLYDDKDGGTVQSYTNGPQQQCNVTTIYGRDRLPMALSKADIVVIGDEMFQRPCIETIHSIGLKAVEYARLIAAFSPNAILVIAASPLNYILPIFAQVLDAAGCFDPRKLLGATSCDTLRASTLLSSRLRLSPQKTILPVIGGASATTRIPLFSQANSPVVIDEETKLDIVEKLKLFDGAEYSEADIIERAYASVRFTHSVLAARRGLSPIPEIALTKTEEIANVEYFSMPLLIGKDGVEKIMKLPKLSSFELSMLHSAVESLNAEVEKTKNWPKLREETPEQSEERSVQFNVTESVSEELDRISSGCYEDKECENGNDKWSKDGEKAFIELDSVFTSETAAKSEGKDITAPSLDEIPKVSTTIVMPHEHDAKKSKIASVNSRHKKSEQHKYSNSELKNKNIGETKYSNASKPRNKDKVSSSKNVLPDPPSKHIYDYLQSKNLTLYERNPASLVPKTNEELFLQILESNMFDLSDTLTKQESLEREEKKEEIPQAQTKDEPTEEPVQSSMDHIFELNNALVPKDNEESFLQILVPKDEIPTALSTVESFECGQKKPQKRKYEEPLPPVITLMGPKRELEQNQDTSLVPKEDEERFPYNEEFFQILDPKDKSNTSKEESAKKEEASIPQTDDEHVEKLLPLVLEKNENTSLVPVENEEGSPFSEELFLQILENSTIGLSDAWMKEAQQEEVSIPQAKSKDRIEKPLPPVIQLEAPKRVSEHENTSLVQKKSEESFLQILVPQEVGLCEIESFARKEEAKTKKHKEEPLPPVIVLTAPAQKVTVPKKKEESVAQMQKPKDCVIDISKTKLLEHTQKTMSIPQQKTECIRDCKSLGMPLTVTQKAIEQKHSSVERQIILQKETLKDNIRQPKVDAKDVGISLISAQKQLQTAIEEKQSSVERQIILQKETLKDNIRQPKVDAKDVGISLISAQKQLQNAIEQKQSSVERQKILQKETLKDNIRQPKDDAKDVGIYLISAHKESESKTSTKTKPTKLKIRDIVKPPIVQINKSRVSIKKDEIKTKSPVNVAKYTEPLSGTDIIADKFVKFDQVLQQIISDIPEEDIESLITEKPKVPIESLVAEKPKVPIESLITEKPKVPIESLIAEKPKVPIESLITEKPKVSIESLIADKPKVPIESLITEKPKVPIESLITEKPKVPIESLITEKPKVPIESLITEKPKVPIESLITEKPKVPTESLIAEKPKVPLESLIAEKPKVPIESLIAEKPKVPIELLIAEKPKVPIESLIAEKPKVLIIDKITITEKPEIFARSEDKPEIFSWSEHKPEIFSRPEEKADIFARSEDKNSEQEKKSLVKNLSKTIDFKSAKIEKTVDHTIANKPNIPEKLPSRVKKLEIKTKKPITEEVKNVYNLLHPQQKPRRPSSMVNKMSDLSKIEMVFDNKIKKSKKPAEKSSNEFFGFQKRPEPMTQVKIENPATPLEGKPISALPPLEEKVTEVILKEEKNINVPQINQLVSEGADNFVKFEEALDQVINETKTLVTNVHWHAGNNLLEKSKKLEAETSKNTPLNTDSPIRITNLPKTESDKLNDTKDDLGNVTSTVRPTGVGEGDNVDRQLRALESLVTSKTSNKDVKAERFFEKLHHEINNELKAKTSPNTIREKRQTKNNLTLVAPSQSAPEIKLVSDAQKMLTEEEEEDNNSKMIKEKVSDNLEQVNNFNKQKVDESSKSTLVKDSNETEEVKASVSKTETKENTKEDNLNINPLGPWSGDNNVLSKINVAFSGSKGDSDIVQKPNIASEDKSDIAQKLNIASEDKSDIAQKPNIAAEDKSDIAQKPNIASEDQDLKQKKPDAKKILLTVESPPSSNPNIAKSIKITDQKNVNEDAMDVSLNISSLKKELQGLRTNRRTNRKIVIENVKSILHGKDQEQEMVYKLDLKMLKTNSKEGNKLALGDISGKITQAQLRSHRQNLIIQASRKIARARPKLARINAGIHVETDENGESQTIKNIRANQSHGRKRLDLTLEINLAHGKKNMEKFNLLRQTISNRKKLEALIQKKQDAKEKTLSQEVTESIKSYGFSLPVKKTKYRFFGTKVEKSVPVISAKKVEKKKSDEHKTIQVNITAHQTIDAKKPKTPKEKMEKQTMFKRIGREKNTTEMEKLKMGKDAIEMEKTKRDVPNLKASSTQPSKPTEKSSNFETVDFEAPNQVWTNVDDFSPGINAYPPMAVDLPWVEPDVENGLTKNDDTAKSIDELSFLNESESMQEMVNIKENDLVKIPLPVIPQPLTNKFQVYSDPEKSVFKIQGHEDKQFLKADPHSIKPQTNAMSSKSDHDNKSIKIGEESTPGKDKSGKGRSLSRNKTPPTDKIVKPKKIVLGEKKIQNLSTTTKSSKSVSDRRNSNPPSAPKSTKSLNDFSNPTPAPKSSISLTEIQNLNAPKSSTDPLVPMKHVNHVEVNLKFADALKKHSSISSNAVEQRKVGESEQKKKKAAELEQSKKKVEELELKKKAEKTEYSLKKPKLPSVGVDLKSKLAPSKIAPEKQAPNKIAPEKQAPSKIVLEKQSPSKIVLEKQSPSKIVLEKQGPSKIVLEKQAPSKIVLEKQGPSKIVLDKQPPTKSVLEKQPSSKSGQEKQTPTKIVLDISNADTKLGNSSLENKKEPPKSTPINVGSSNSKGTKNDPSSEVPKNKIQSDKTRSQNASEVNIKNKNAKPETEKDQSVRRPVSSNDPGTKVNNFLSLNDQERKHVALSDTGSQKIIVPKIEMNDAQLLKLKMSSNSSTSGMEDKPPVLKPATQSNKILDKRSVPNVTDHSLLHNSKEILPGNSNREPSQALEKYSNISKKATKIVNLSKIKHGSYKIKKNPKGKTGFSKPETDRFKPFMHLSKNKQMSEIQGLHEPTPKDVPLRKDRFNASAGGSHQPSEYQKYNERSTKSSQFKSSSQMGEKLGKNKKSPKPPPNVPASKAYSNTAKVALNQQSAKKSIFPPNPHPIADKLKPPSNSQNAPRVDANRPTNADNSKPEETSRQNISPTWGRLFHVFKQII